MNLQILAIASILPTLASLKSGIDTLTKDNFVKSSINKNPALKSRVEALSAQWRAVESAIEAVKKAQGFAIGWRVYAAATALKKLWNQATAFRTDPEIRDAVKLDPRLSAVLDQVSSDLRTIQEEASALGIKL